MKIEMHFKMNGLKFDAGDRSQVGQRNISFESIRDGLSRVDYVRFKDGVGIIRFVVQP